MRQSVRASLAGDGDEDEEEDRDKKLNEEIEANEGGTKGKGKGRGRGRGLKRPAAAIKTDAVAPQSSKKTEPSGDECEDDIPATQPDSDEPDQVDVPEVQPKKKKTQGKSPVASPKPAPASKKKDTSTKNAKPSKPSIKPPKKESPKLTKNAVPKKKPSKRTVEEYVLRLWMHVHIYILHYITLYYHVYHACVRWKFIMVTARVQSDQKILTMVWHWKVCVMKECPKER